MTESLLLNCHKYARTEWIYKQTMNNGRTSKIYANGMNILATLSSPDSWIMINKEIVLKKMERQIIINRSNGFWVINIIMERWKFLFFHFLLPNNANLGLPGLLLFTFRLLVFPFNLALVFPKMSKPQRRLQRPEMTAK